MADKLIVLLLMGVLLITGLALLINLPQMMGINLGLGFNNITGVFSGITVIGVKIVGLILTLLSIFVIYNLFRD